MIHFPNAANGNKWSTQWDLIEMHNCIVIHTHFHANAAPHTYASPVIYTDTPVPRIYTAHTQICRQNQLIDKRHRNSHIWRLTLKHAAHTKRCCLRTSMNTHTHTHSIPRPLHSSVNPSRQSVLRGSGCRFLMVIAKTGGGWRGARDVDRQVEGRRDGFLLPTHKSLLSMQCDFVSALCLVHS